MKIEQGVLTPIISSTKINDHELKTMTNYRDTLRRYLTFMTENGLKIDGKGSAFTALLADIDDAIDDADNRYYTSRSRLSKAFRKVFDIIIDKCAISVNAYASHGKVLYRGNGSKPLQNTIYVSKPFLERRNRDSDSRFTEILNNAILHAGYKAHRNNSVFASSNLIMAETYGEVLAIFPLDSTPYTWCDDSDADDMVLTSGNLSRYKLFNDDTMFEFVKELNDLYPIVENRNIYESVFGIFDKEFLTSLLNKTFPRNTFTIATSSFDIITMMNQINLSIQMGILDDSFRKYTNKRVWLPSDEEIMKILNIKNTDFEDALKKKYEVMIGGVYFGMTTSMLQSFSAYLQSKGM